MLSLRLVSQQLVSQNFDSVTKAFVAGHIEQVINDQLKRFATNMPAQGLRNLAHGVIVRCSHSEAPFPPERVNDILPLLAPSRGLVLSIANPAASRGGVVLRPNYRSATSPPPAVHVTAA